MHWNDAQVGMIRTFLEPLFQTYGVDVVFNGHAHFYERSEKDDIYYITSGGGGASLRDEVDESVYVNDYQQLFSKAYHYCVVDITPTTVHLQVFREDEALIDSVKLPTPSVDVALVLDRSGSMKEPTGVPNLTKMEMAREAASLFISLLRDQDRVGIVRYNNSADILLNLTEVGGIPEGKQEAMSKLDDDLNWEAILSTSIGSGIIEGCNVLGQISTESELNENRVMVLLTDGKHNTSPSINQGLATAQEMDPIPRIFSVGLGLSQDINQLGDVSTVTNGSTTITGALVDENEFLLQKLYVQILADACGETIVTDPRRVANPGQKQATSIYLGEVDRGADFILVYRRSKIFPNHLRFWLQAPNGSLIQPDNISTYPRAEIHQHGGHILYRCSFPVFQKHLSMHHGHWKVWVENFSKVESLYYSVICKAQSSLRLLGGTVQNTYLVGDPMILFVKPLLSGKPMHLASAPVVEMARPDKERSKVVLKPLKDGTYQGKYEKNSLPGPYHGTLKLELTTPRGLKVTRYRHLAGYCQTSLDMDYFDEMRQLVKRLHDLVEHCCDQKKKSDGGNNHRT